MNLGYGGGANIGIEQALSLGADWVIIMNQDLKITRKGLKKFADELKRTNPALVGPFAGSLDEKRWTTMLSSKPVDYISGGCMAIHRDVIDKIGNFYEPYFMYYEDADYCIRAKKSGFPLIQSMTSDICHEDNPYQGKGSFLHECYLARNHLLFVERQALLSVKLYEWSRLPKSYSEFLESDNKGGLSGIKDYLLRRFGEKIYEYQLDASGRVNIVSGNPTMISSNPFNLVSNDNRLTQPATILFKDSKGTEKYIVNITDYSLEDDRITVAMQLCTYENGWKSYWDKVSYSVWTEKGKRESPVGARNAKVGTALLADFINYKNNAEIRADFMSTNKSTISVYLYIAEDEKSIHSIAFDSAKESANTIFRFNLNAASIQTIQDALTPEELTPDQVREKLTVQIKGTKNAKGADTTFSLITAEGPLNREGNANPTFDAKYWKVGKTPITPGEYKFLFTIPGYRPIERTVLINAKDLSTSDPNKLIQADVFDSFNIRPEDLKEDRCTNATTLELGLLCVDTAFVDAIISSK